MALGVLTTTVDVSSSDNDDEMCRFVQSPEGTDVQLVCDSDPTHPISTAEQALLDPIIPTTLLQDIEHKLEADISTLFVTIIFAVAFIMVEFGVTDLIDHYFGETVLSSIVCVLVGLGIVVWVKFNDFKLIRLWPEMLR